MPFLNLITATRGDGVVISTGTLRTVSHGRPMLWNRPLSARGTSRELQRRGDSQDGDEERIPELLGLGKVVAVAVELARGGVVAVVDADEDPDHDDGAPASETVVALEEAGDVS